MDLTSWKLPNGTYTMEVNSRNLHQGSYLVDLHHESYFMELTSSNLTSGTYTMEVTSWNLHHGSYLMELTPWKLPYGTNTNEVT